MDKIFYKKWIMLILNTLIISHTVLLSSASPLSWLKIFRALEIISLWYMEHNDLVELFIKHPIILLNEIRFTEQYPQIHDKSYSYIESFVIMFVRTCTWIGNNMIVHNIFTTKYWLSVHTIELEHYIKMNGL